jgi:pimeloyl-ACP methyl ester carboxylesterase
MKRLAATAVFLVFGITRAFAGDLGVVVLPGKNSVYPNGLVGALAQALENAGIAVETPEVPWSQKRYLDKDYDDSMLEIDQAVARLKAKGATKIVVGGQSMGSNAALGYGARRDGLAGIADISPGHVVEPKPLADLFRASVARAKSMVEAGRGTEKAEFQDNDQGKRFFITVEARVYLSWFAPDGPTLFPKNAAALKPGTALLWMFGEKDPMNDRGRAYAFDKAPANPKSKYAVVSGGHLDVMRSNAADIVAWVKSLD